MHRRTYLSNNNPFYGKKHSDETRIRMRLNHKGMIGKHHSEGARNKIGAAHRGIKNKKWKGGIRKDSNGYILILNPSHHRANIQGYVKEHILVYETHNRCSVLKWAVVNHINHIKDDNRIANLQLMSHGSHSSYHRKKEMSENRLYRFWGRNKAIMS